MLPTAIVASPNSFLILSANGVWYMRPVYRLLVRHDLGRWRRDQIDARLLEARASASRSSSERPPGAQSVAEIRIDMGLSPGQAARTARNTSSG